MNQPSLSNPSDAPSTSNSSSALNPIPYSTSRRRSVDVGGLALALQQIETGTGKGWGGWESAEDQDIRYAELLCDMYIQTNVTLDIPVMLPIEAVSPERRAELINQLSSWSFEPYKLPDEEAFVCTEIVFESLLRIEGMQEKLNISMDKISPFLRQLRAIYRTQNHYHNFKHAIDVLQATALFLHNGGVVPPVSILLEDGKYWRRRSSKKKKSSSSKKKREPGLLKYLHSADLLALYLAAIGHDVGHPGLSNAFMKNAQTPLSIVYNDVSALEQMHCALLMHIMRRHDMIHLLSPSFKKMLHGIVLSTDMSLHKKWMETFTHFTNEQEVSQQRDQERVRLLCCQAIIKCADISNPARPHAIARNWAAALHSEWATQAQLEKHLNMTVSVKKPDDAKEEANGQIGFITACTLPLFRLCMRTMPALKFYTKQCESTLATWHAKLKTLERPPNLNSKKSSSKLKNSSRPSTSDSLPPPLPTDSFLDMGSALSYTLPTALTANQDVDDSSEATSTPPSASPDAPLSTVQSPTSVTSYSNAPSLVSSRHHLAPRSPSSLSISEMSLNSLDTRATDSTIKSSANMELIRAAYAAGGIPKQKNLSTHRGSWAPTTSTPLLE